MTIFTSCRSLRKKPRNLSLFPFCGDINITKISLVPAKISPTEVGGSFLAPMSKPLNFYRCRIGPLIIVNTRFRRTWVPQHRGRGVGTSTCRSGRPGGCRTNNSTNKEFFNVHISLYQLPWTWNDQKLKSKNAYTVVNWFSGKLVNLMPTDVRF